MNASDDTLIVAPVVKPIPTTKQQRAEWAKRYVESGLSLREFSAQNGLGYMSLWRWVNQARGKAAAVMDCSAPGFTEIKVLPSIEGSNWVAELSLPTGKVLRFSKEVPASMLEELLRLC
jgi:hypothetical protein